MIQTCIKSKKIKIKEFMKNNNFRMSKSIILRVFESIILNVFNIVWKYGSRKNFLVERERERERERDEAGKARQGKWRWRAWREKVGTQGQRRRDHAKPILPVKFYMTSHVMTRYLSFLHEVHVSLQSSHSPHFLLFKFSVKNTLNEFQISNGMLWKIIPFFFSPWH